MAKKKKEARTHLTEVEMLKIDNYNLKVNILKYQHAILDKEYRLYLTSAEKKKIEINAERNKAEKERKEYNENIKKEFDLTSETWGYDPLTGEVK